MYFLNKHISKFKVVFSFFILNILFLNTIFGQQPIKIACVGNSITYGIGVVNREKNNFPQQLQSLLGVSYKVSNFGTRGVTLLPDGNLPYANTTEYKNSIKCKPNIVVIDLGNINPEELEIYKQNINNSFYDNFEKDYTQLIKSYSNLSSHPRVILLLPLPSFLVDSNSIFKQVIQKQIISSIQKMAFETGVEVLDLHSLFVDKSDLFLDKVHPSSLGATIISKRLYELITLNEVKQTSVFLKVKQTKSLSSFYGFECIDFKFNNRNAKVVRPKKVVKGSPWVWRARFWGHEPQTDIALLERGFHIVYCDVAELYGNKESVLLWDQFYAYMQQLGLSKKVVLEGMSRGGIYIYNWAYHNPKKVAAVYADAPVLDLKSWPGGKGKGPGSKEDWVIFKNDYQLTEEQANQFHENPIDHADSIAKEGFPMLHVVGDADEVVPVEENTNPFEIKVKKAGGSITVIHKAGVGHHPHSLENPTPIVDFILKSTGYNTHFATIATPSAEYRSAAGWKEGTDWWVQNDDINQLIISNKKLDIIFLGNSITQGIGGERPSVTYKPGKIFFDSAFKGYQWVSAGISGDRTQHVLWRLQHGTYALAKPKVIVLTIGVNNFNEDSGEETASGIKLILQWMKLHLPQTKIILIGPLPTGLKPESSNRLKYEVVHSIIKKEATQQIIYLPLTKYFIKENGDLDTRFCSGDGIHLIEPGYELWAKVLSEAVRKMIK